MKKIVPYTALLLLVVPVSARALPQCLSSMTTKPALAPYVAYLTAHTNVVQAINPCKLAPKVRASFIIKMEQAEVDGQPPTAPLPDAWSSIDRDATNTVQGGAQTEEILGAKLAHMLYVEVHQLVPWRLHNYGSVDLIRLVTPCKLPSAWCSNTAPSFMVQDVLDHSPRETWSVVKATIDLGALTTQHAAMGELLKHLRFFSHGGVYYDSNGNVTASTTGGIRTVAEMAGEGISRSGCWSTVPYLLALAEALNIPGEGIFDYYASPGHATALLPYSDQVLSHGDHPYNALLANTPSIDVYDTYSHWQTEILRYKPRDPRALYNSQKHEYEMDQTYPSQYLLKSYCAQGRPGGLDDWFGSYATPLQMDALEATMLQITSSCTVFPADDPDAP
jgi:hypothetical protein